MKVKAAIFSWNQIEAKSYAAYVREQIGVETFTVTGFNHETVLLNRAIEECQAEFLWFLTPDVDLPYTDCISKMIEVFDNPKVGVVLPNREDDPGVGGKVPYKKYLADGTAQLYRISVRAWFDEEFIYTGWSDLDFGKEVERRGYEVWVDPRTAVKKNPTAYGSWSSFRRAYNARNRLLYEAKWYWVDKWLYLDWYNQHCEPNRRIPTQFQLAMWSDEKLNAFADSVEHEHPEIMLDDGKGTTGNVDWSFDYGN